MTGTDTGVGGVTGVCGGMGVIGDSAERAEEGGLSYQIQFSVCGALITPTPPPNRR